MGIILLLSSFKKCVVQEFKQSCVLDCVLQIQC